jgi:hypothetical protein
MKAIAKKCKSRMKNRLLIFFPHNSNKVSVIILRKKMSNLFFILLLHFLAIAFIGTLFLFHRLYKQSTKELIKTDLEDNTILIQDEIAEDLITIFRDDKKSDTEGIEINLNPQDQLTEKRGKINRVLSFIDKKIEDHIANVHATNGKFPENFLGKYDQIYGILRKSVHDILTLSDAAFVNGQLFDFQKLCEKIEEKDNITFDELHQLVCEYSEIPLLPPSTTKSFALLEMKDLNDHDSNSSEVQTEKSEVEIFLPCALSLSTDMSISSSSEIKDSEIAAVLGIKCEHRNATESSGSTWAIEDDMVFVQ